MRHLQVLTATARQSTLNPVTVLANCTAHNLSTRSLVPTTASPSASAITATARLMHHRTRSSSSCRTAASLAPAANCAQRACALQLPHAGRMHAIAPRVSSYSVASPFWFGQQHVARGNHSSWHSSEWQQQPQHSPVRCHSTSNPSPRPFPSIHPSVSWLCEVQSWPSQLALNGSSSSNSHNGNGNGNSTGSSAVAQSFQEYDSVNPADLPNMHLDAIVVLAGGLLPNGGMPEWAKRRLDLGRDLHMLLGRTPPILCSGGGTPHKPAVLGPSGHVLHESTSMAHYLMDSGVAAGAILKETASFDTVGNTYMSLAIHALPSGWRNIAVVTSHFHMPRSRALFTDVYRLAGSSVFGDPHRFKLVFLSAGDDGVFNDHVYKARLEKEAGSVQHWQGVFSGLHSLADMHAWLHADHLCYAVPRQSEFGKQTIQDQKLLESY